MDLLKLVVLDEQDLTIVSAHVQDAVTKVGDLKYLEEAKSFVVPMNRFAWETQGGRMPRTPERRNSVLHFDRVLAVKATGIARDRPAETLALLAIGFEPGATPAGAVTLTFSGGGAIRLEVECIEARLADLGGAWQAISRPRHAL
jgi:hypothetical protein